MHKMIKVITEILVWVTYFIVWSSLPTPLGEGEETGQGAMTSSVDFAAVRKCEPILGWLRILGMSQFIFIYRKIGRLT